MKEIFLFSAPVIKYTINNCDLNKIEQQCKLISLKTKTRNKSNKGGFQSPDIDFNKNKNFQQLSNAIKKCIDEYNINYFNIKNDILLDNCWVNINKKNNSNVPHDHFDCIFSAVFYVKTNENSGDLIFHRGDNYHYFSHVYEHTNYNTFNSQIYSFSPKNGDLYIFPSWLKHEVSENLSKKERISIAFNYK
jgi:uncharacterized protein (TIGR02466 family)